MVKRKNMAKWLSTLLSMTMLFAPLSSQAAAVQTETADEAYEGEGIVTDADGEINGHTLVAETAEQELYLLEETLSIIVRDKNSGAIMESTIQEPGDNVNDTWANFMKSGIGFEILEQYTEEKSDLISSGADISVELNATGFTADIYMEKYGIGLQLVVSLEEDGLTVEIPEESIIEEKEEVSIGSIYVYPFLGHTFSGERDGYMFVPDGNGALIYLDDKEGRYTSPMTLNIYGDNVGYDESYVLSLMWDKYQTVNESEPVMAPVYGMVHTDSQFGFLGIITEGAFDAQIVAYPNGAVTDYNWITPKFTLRRVYEQPTSLTEGGSVTIHEEERTQYDICITYQFVSGEDADYTGLALAYQDYLLEDVQLEPVTSDAGIRLDFLGTEREDGILFEKTVTMTTADQIGEIFEELTAAGVTDILSVYKGWQKGGLYNLPISSYKADRSIGGNSGVSQLLSDAKEQGIEMYLYQDALRANPEKTNTTFNVIKKVNERRYEEEMYQDVYEYFVYQTPDQSSKLLKNAAADYQKADISNLALTGISNQLFAYLYSGETYSRYYTADTYETTIAELDEEMNLLLEQPFAYLWNYTDGILDMPVASSDYIFTDQEVPFMSIALKGIIPMYSSYVNFEANKTEYFLKLVETGITPSFYLTYEDSTDLIYTNSADLYSTGYNVHKDDVIAYYEELNAIRELTADARITGHEQSEDDLVTVTYSNGVKIYVNYGTTTADADGLSIAPMSYEVGEGV